MHGLAGVYSVASAAALEDAKLPSASCERLAVQYAARALQLLIKARDTGYFKDPSVIEQLKTDADLAPLRAGEDFYKLLPELQEKKTR